MPITTKKFYTMGYGITTKEDFLFRLKCISKTLGMSLSLVDIRQFESKSRNGEWCYQGGNRADTGLSKTVAQSKLPVEYHTASGLANGYPGTKAGLEQYRQYLKGSRRLPSTLAARNFIKLRVLIRFTYLGNIQKAIILLCSERKPFKTAKTPNCHRIILAEELLEDLGDGWEVEHL